MIWILDCMTKNCPELKESTHFCMTKNCLELKESTHIVINFVIFPLWHHIIPLWLTSFHAVAAQVFNCWEYSVQIAYLLAARINKTTTNISNELCACARARAHTHTCACSCAHKLESIIQKRLCLFDVQLPIFNQDWTSQLGFLGNRAIFKFKIQVFFFFS